MKKIHDKAILYKISQRRFLKSLKRRKKRKLLRRINHIQYLRNVKSLNSDISYESILNKLLPVNLSYLLNCEKSDFHIKKLKSNIPENGGTLRVPEIFSIVDNPKVSFKFIQEVTAALITQKYKIVNIDYGDCIRADLGAQVLLDIVLKDVISFYKKARSIQLNSIKVAEINGTNITNDSVAKLLFSVGSPAIHSNKAIHFNDIIPYKLCIHNRESSKDPLKAIEKKDLDTTTLVDYVLDCLKRLNKTLTPEKIDDLCIVISEILINAEEHSTTRYRFSIGYFHEISESGKHYGVFRLAILNFGKTIYEKFKDPLCPNQDIVKRMESLSQSYTKRNIFLTRQFEEETLWTLYALQEGVTTVAPDQYRKRGHGSIQFIESFFNIKGHNNKPDEISRLAILSGNASIVFDGTYEIHQKDLNGETFKYMTFNRSKKIEDKPDSKFVKFVDNYFPGTIITAKILFNDDDFSK